MPTPVTTTTNLEVAFSSDVTPAQPTQPVAMAYGYSDNSSGVNSGKGQREETVWEGSSVYFLVFDTAASPTYSVSSVTISAANTRPGTGAANSPFTDAAWSTGTVVATSSPTGPNGVQLSGPTSNVDSVGCNVVGKGWSCGPFTVGTFKGQRFEITINVLTSDSQSHQKTFSVDPEMVVDGGNP
ncbi:MAG: hypothetical protein LC795_10350 [Acidobacteria bacterium]|nr:hypothetical protein [Acidobacteriota bacterium]